MCCYGHAYGYGPWSGFGDFVVFCALYRLPGAPTELSFAAALDRSARPALVFSDIITSLYFLLAEAACFSL